MSATTKMPLDRGFLILPDILNERDVEALRGAVDSMRLGRAGVRHVLANLVVRAL